MRTGKYSLIHARLAVAALSIACLAAGHVSAATVSYNFSQGGWSDGASDTGTLTGTFTGTDQANGDRFSDHLFRLLTICLTLDKPQPQWVQL
jgi:hypothetical protein